MTADEVAEIERNKGEAGGDLSKDKDAQGATDGGSVGSKRKSDGDSTTPSKKAKTSESADDDDEEEEDDVEDDG